MPRTRLLFGLCLWAGLSACTTRSSQQPEQRTEAPVAVQGIGNIQRTLRLLESGREPVRVLFYGQSITQSSWSRKVERTLRERYPDSDLQIENRSLGGFASQLLAKTAETDLYPFYPDLLVFAVYGDHHRYEDIIRRTRERTTSEVLIQNDHVLRPSDLAEELDPEKLEPRAATWEAFMNQRFLPSLVERYRVALCDQRSAWKRHLRAHTLPPSALLSDHVHLNAAGDALMARFVEQCLRRAPGEQSPAEGWVRTLELGHDLEVHDGKLSLVFEGNRIDVITREQGGAAVHVRIDGKPPSELPELYNFTRAHTDGADKWPVVFDLSAQAPLRRETFTLAITRGEERGSDHERREDGSPAHYAFELTGSVTGFDGRGRSDQRFVSQSGRVIIEPEDWNVEYAFELAGTSPIPAQFSASFRSEARALDAFASGADERGRARTLTLAQGLAATEHTLELSGDLEGVRALRIYRPPLARSR
jgi:hypothetical protein